MAWSLFVRFYDSRVGLSMAWAMFVRFYNTREVVVHSLIAILQVLQHKRGERCSIITVRQGFQYKRDGCSWLGLCSTTQGVIQYKYLTEVDLQFVCEPERCLKKIKDYKNGEKGSAVEILKKNRTRILCFLQLQYQTKLHVGRVVTDLMVSEIGRSE